MIELILHLLCLGAAILLISRILPGMHVDSYGTSVMVAIVYGLINVTLGFILKLLGLPFIVITLGIFLIIINAFLLWLTDQLLDDFEIEDIGTTFVAALLITIADTILAMIF
ncbi:MAG: phage holin family protein [Proteobacteria bacterium]|nr:phage holin family protein [Pseudomonadota bacterium]